MNLNLIENIRSDLKTKILVQDQDGAEFQPAGVLKYVEDLRPTKRVGSDGPSSNAGKRGPNAEIGLKDYLEIASKHFTRTPESLTP